MAQLRDVRFNARDVTPQYPQPRRFLELGAGLLQAQVENLLPPIPAIRQEFGQRLLLNLFPLRLLHNQNLRGLKSTHSVP